MDTHDTEQTKRKPDRDDQASTKRATASEATTRPTASAASSQTTRNTSERTSKSSTKKKPSVQKNNVRKLRTERMMSKAELARRAGLSTLTIDRVEKGMPCRMDTKRKILEALGLTPSDRVAVFGEED